MTFRSVKRSAADSCHEAGPWPSTALSTFSAVARPVGPDAVPPVGWEQRGAVPTLYVMQGPDKGRTFHTDDEPTVLGRGSDQVPLTDHSISRQHAELRQDNGTWVLKDCHSSNGTYLNGSRVYESTPIKHGDQIRLGSTLMVFGGEESCERFSGPGLGRDLVELDAEDNQIDSSILASASAAEESVILASPETSDAVHAWNVMYQLAETIGTFASVGEFLERMTDTIMNHLRVDRIFVLMRESKEKELEPYLVRYRTPPGEERTKITTSRRIINHVLQNKEGILCANAQTDLRFGTDTKDGSIHRLGLRSVICVPIITHDEAVGIIHLDCSMANHTYTHQQLHLVTAIGRIAGMAIENARLIESRVKHERLAAVGETVAHLSHHIRNLLQGMRSGADVIEMGLKRRSLQHVGPGWQIVQRNLERTYRLATNMLTFSKERQPHIEMAQLNKVIEEVITLVQGQADDHGVMLLADLDELPAIPLDIDGIHQVATNIIINALDAAPRQTGQVLVRTSYDPHKAEVTLLIGDNGPGIPEDELDRIFDVFHSTKGHGGTGLGLAAAKKIVDELNGSIEVKSTSEGTRFFVHLNAVDTKLADSDKTHGPNH